MVGVSRGSGSIFVGKPFVAEVHTVHDSVAVDGGDVHLDAGDPEHLIRIKHTRNDGIDVLAAIDKTTSTKTIYMDSTGSLANLNARVSGAGHITCKGITLDGDDLETTLGDTNFSVQVNEDALEAQGLEIDGLQEEVGEADREASPTGDNIMRRHPNFGTSVANFHVVADDNDGYLEPFPPRGLYWTRGTCLEILNLLNNAQLQFRSFDAQGNEILTKRIVFGRAEPLVGETLETASPDRDGLLLEDETDNQISEIYCNQNVPNIRLTGIKAVQSGQPVCPVFEVIGQGSNTVFAVYDDGHVRWGGHLASDSLPGDPDLSDSTHASVYVGDTSLYIGDCRITFDRVGRALKLAVLKDQIPTFLAAAGVTSTEVAAFGASANGELSVHSWSVLARTHTGNDHLRIKDVFPAANPDWNDAVFEGHAAASDMVQAQADITQAQTDITALQGGGSSNLTDDSLHLDAGAASTPAILRLTKDYQSSGNTNDDCPRIVLEQTNEDNTNPDPDYHYSCYEMRVDRDAADVFLLTHRARFTDSIASDQKILTYKPDNTHLGLHNYFGGGHSYSDPGICMKHHVRTWGSVGVGELGSETGIALRTHQGVDFFRRDAQDQDEDVYALIDANSSKVGITPLQTNQILANKTLSEANEAAVAGLGSGGCEHLFTAGNAAFDLQNDTTVVLCGTGGSSTSDGDQYKFNLPPDPQENGYQVQVIGLCKGSINTHVIIYKNSGGSPLAGYWWGNDYSLGNKGTGSPKVYETQTGTNYDSGTKGYGQVKLPLSNCHWWLTFFDDGSYPKWHISTAGGSGELNISGGGNYGHPQFNLSDLETTDPTIAGQLWNDQGDLKISLG